MQDCSISSALAMEILQSCTKPWIRQWPYMSAMVSQITGKLTVGSTPCLDWQQRKHWSSALLYLCEENPPLTSGFPSQRAKNAESFSMSWCQHVRTQGASYWAQPSQKAYDIIKTELRGNHTIVMFLWGYVPAEWTLHSESAALRPLSCELISNSQSQACTQK